MTAVSVTANTLPALPQPKDRLLQLANFQDLMQLGDVLAKSGMFSDARGAAQAVVKVLAGRELGFSPIASMTGVHVIEGKPSIGAHLMASMIKRSGRYDYKVIRCDKSACKLHFLERSGDRQDRWQDLGEIEMTMEEAVASGLAIGRDGKLKTNWSRSSDDMLFARCVSKGFRRYCPDLTGGVTVYDPDEIETALPGVPTPGQPFAITYPDRPTPAPIPPPIDASYSISHENGNTTHVGMDKTTHFPAPPVGPREQHPSRDKDPETGNLIHSPPEGNGQPPATEIPPPPATDRKLAEPEVAELGELIRESGADVKKFLAHFKVKTVRQMTSSQYQKAIFILRSKMAKSSSPTQA